MNGLVRFSMTACALVLGCTGRVPWASARMLDAAFVETQIATVPMHITGMAWAPDGSGRLFLTQKEGSVLIFAQGQVNAVPFATISPVFIDSETGLLALAFDPDFSNNQFVYVFATVSETEQRIIRLRAAGDVAVEESVVVSGLPTRGRNHNGGAVGFGPDGKLYWAIGDNGNATGVGDDLASLASKVGRAEPDGTVPLDNPFADGDGPNADYIWARGLRNPFTFTWQPRTEQLWINVVGIQYEQVIALGAGDHAGWRTYESSQPAGFVPPVISYSSDAPLPLAIAANGAARADGSVTLATDVEHRLRPGATVTVVGVADPSFDTEAIVTGVPSSTTLSFSQAGPDAVSGGGSVTGPAIGGCITGGTFLDSTAVPESYRGDYFFGDFLTMRIMRAHLEPETNAVLGVDVWTDGIQRPIDIAVGPDGDLYYVGYGGRLFQARYAANESTIVISEQHLRVREGGQRTIGVRLGAPIASPLVVEVSRSDGDPNVGVEDTSLRFTADDWAVPQLVRVVAAEDDDATDDAATLLFSSAELASVSAIVRVTDNDLFAQEGGAGASAGNEGGNGGAAEAGHASVEAAEGGVGGASGGGGEAMTAGVPSEGGVPAGHAGEADSGCGCRHAATVNRQSAWLALLLGLSAVRWRRRARGTSRPTC